MHRTRRLIPVLVLAASAAVLPGCDAGAGDAGSQAETDALRAQVKKLEGERDRLAGRMEQAERRISGLSTDLAATREEMMKAAQAAGVVAAARPTEAGEPAPAAATDARTPSAKALGDLLATEDGRAVFEEAMKAYEARRDAERIDRLGSGIVDGFAQRANLSPQQTESLRKIVGKAMGDVAAVWRGGRDGEATPEERAAQRQSAFAKMEEIRQRTDDEVKGILDAAQWDQWQQDSARMRGFLGGGAGPGGGFGGGRGGLGR